MIKILRNTIAYTFTISSICFAIIPESFFLDSIKFNSITETQRIVTARILFCLLIFVLCFLFVLFCTYLRTSVTIKGKNYIIKIRYGDIFKFQKCKKVIPFDECYTTNVGENTEDINKASICGQYLKLKGTDIKLLRDNLKPSSKSKFKNKPCYKSGTLIPNDDYLLMAFAKLNKHGSADMTRETFIESLNFLWEEISKNHCQKDVCIPILGSGCTIFKEAQLNTQELLDIIVLSYQLNPYKLKSPCKLYIVCKRQQHLSLHKIGTTI